MKFVDYIDTQPRAIKVGGLVENQGNWTAAKLCLRATFCWFFISHVRLEKRKKNGKAKEKKMGSTGNAVRIEQTISLLICANWFERLKCAVIDTHPHTKPYTQTQILTRTPRQRGTNTNTRIQAIYMEINTNIFTMARTKNKKEG